MIRTKNRRRPTATAARRAAPAHVARSASVAPQDLRNEFARRRRSLLKLMGRDSIAILPAAPVRHRNNDVEYAYRQDSDFYYLTGFDEPESVAVLFQGRDPAE